MTTPAREIVQSLRGKWYGGPQGYGMIRCPAHPDKVPSCRVRDGENGAPLVSCYSGCERLDIISALKRLNLWPAAEYRDRQPSRHPERRRYASSDRPETRARAVSDEEGLRIAFARRIWEGAANAAGTIVEAYWTEARGLRLPIPSVIRYGEAVPYGYDKLGAPPARRLPAMVAMIEAPDGSFAGVHATYLLPDGSDKRRDLPNERLVFGCPAGGAIRLSEAVDELAIGEGIESTASYMQEFGVAGWAAMNTSGVRSIILPPPPVAFMVTLIGENDDGPSEKAIAVATARLRLEGRLVGSVYPAEEFKDFNSPYQRAA